MKNGGKTDSLIFKVLNSEIRIKILNVIMNHDQGLKFTQISKLAKISPTVLEHHLKIMLTSGIISHNLTLYIPNINSKLYYHLITKCKARVISGKHEYFKSHIFPPIITPFLADLHNIEFEIIPDLFSFLTNMADYFVQEYSIIKIAGTMNLNLEELGMKFLKKSQMYDFMNKKVEIILSNKTFEDLKKYDNREIFWKAINIELLETYIIDELNILICIFDKMGFLFLPNLENQIEYANIIVFSSEKEIKWLNSMWEYIKLRSKKISKFNLKQLL